MNQATRREKEKQAREEEIIAAAERVFYRKGFDGASMDEVAKEAQFTKRTVYQYFVNKEDLYFAVALKGFRKLITYFEEAMAKGVTGFEKVRLSGMAYYQFYKDHPDTFRLLNRCRFIRGSEESSPVHLDMMSLEGRMFKMFMDAIAQGIADKSIRPDLDAQKGAYFVVSVSVGFLHMLSEAGKTFEEHYELDQEEFILFALDLLCDALRGNSEHLVSCQKSPVK